MEHLHLQAENRWLKEALGRSFDRHHIIGQSPGMLNLLQMVAQVAVSEATVLITGESGTGKELIAGAMHFNSQRKNGPFVKFNCAAITESLLESELFGHEKGAFTGADRRREGRFRQADGGTLLLDEVSEMSLTMQAKLLRVLQEREITRVGGEDVLPVDVRVLAATNRNLKDMVDANMFREDLYYRLNVVNLHLPPLRARVEDIPLLAQHFLEKFTLQNKKKIKGFSPQAMDRLLRHPWPGNVRELMNAIERATVLTPGEFVDTDYLPPAVRLDEASGAPAPNATAAQVSLEEVEKAAILNTLEAVQGNKSEAARRLGITRKTLHNKLKNYE
jgi:two-component system, NtrC family, response regulator HydG